MENHENGNATGSFGLTFVVLAIVLILLGYGLLVAKNLPQSWTAQANAIHAEHEHEHAAEHGHGAEHGQEADHAAVKNHPPYWMIIPFALLLLAIAILPLIHATEHWWESNLHRFYVAAGLGLLTLLYYYTMCDFPVEQHWPGHAVVSPETDGGFAVAKTIFINAIISEFIPFIVLLFSLFTITGGIRIEGNLKATPMTNSKIIFIGSVLASFVGTTGAAMLLIRLLIETNKERKHKVHTIVFFIFCVCNCGGCLLPIGDPPLFLGYLQGIDFLWTLHLYKEWLFVNCFVIAIFFVWDTFWFYPRETKPDKALDASNQTGLKISGLGVNLPLLIGVVLAVALLDPTKPFPGTTWYPWYFLREMIQLGLCAVSIAVGSKKIRFANSFNFAAIIEVAALFFGIFICMQAPLQILNEEGKNLVATVESKTGVSKPKLFYWATGALSSVLDNAPTYVVFFQTAKSLSPNSEEEMLADPEYKAKHEKGEMVPIKGGKSGYIDFHLLAAVSLGAVFMGSMTYIGNGPNFMVKAIAEQSGVKMPSFFGYMAYSCLILLPIFVIMTLIFL